MADPDKYVEEWKTWWRAGAPEAVEGPGSEHEPASEIAQIAQDQRPGPNADSASRMVGEGGWSPIAHLLFGIAIGAGAAGVIALARNKQTGRTQ
jgi:hypothetical protein